MSPRSSSDRPRAAAAAAAAAAAVVVVDSLAPSDVRVLVLTNPLIY